MQVYAHRIEANTARHFVYGQGTAQAVRREILAFETDGRVAYVKDTSPQAVEHWNAFYQVATERYRRSGRRRESAELVVRQVSLLN